MKYKGMNENTIRKMLQSNETTLLQKGVTDMLNTITNTTDSLLSSFSIEKFFSNKNFSDLSAFVKNILDNTKNIAEKAYNANISNSALEKTITDYMKQINVNTKKTSESVNKISTDTKNNNKQDLKNPIQIEDEKLEQRAKLITDIYKKPLELLSETISNKFSEKISTPLKNYFSGLKNSGIEKFNKSFPLLSKVISNLSSDYTEEQTKEEEKQRSLKQNKLAEEQVGWLQGSLMPWLKKFGEEQRLESDGFIATFFPMLATMINASPLLLKLIGFGKLFLGIAGGIFGAVKFIEGIGKAVDVLGHEIDFTSLHGWLEALNLGLGNIVSSITGIDLKTVYNWLNNFDRTLSNAYKRYLQPIIKPLLDTVWKSIKSLFEPFVDKIRKYAEDFAKEYPGMIQIFNNIYNFMKTEILPPLKSVVNWTINFAKDIGNAISREFKGVNFKVIADTVNETIVESIANISTILTTMWNFVTKVVTDISNIKWYDALNPASILATITKSMYEGVTEGIENFGDLKDKNIIFMKEGNEGLEKRELEEERDELRSQRSELNTLSKMYANVAIKKGWLGGTDYEAMAGNISQGFLESLKEGGISETEAKQTAGSIETLLLAHLERLQQESQGNDEKFIENINEFLKSSTKVYTDPLIASRTQSIQSLENQINEYQNIINKRKGIQPVKSSNQIENNMMSANNQAEIRAEETKPAQPTINANGSGNVITNNNYNNTTSNVQSGLNEQQMMESAKNTAN